MSKGRIVPIHIIIEDNGAGVEISLSPDLDDMNAFIQAQGISADNEIPMCFHVAKQAYEHALGIRNLILLGKQRKYDYVFPLQETIN